MTATVMEYTPGPQDASDSDTLKEMATASAGPIIEAAFGSGANESSAVPSTSKGPINEVDGVGDCVNDAEPVWLEVVVGLGVRVDVTEPL